MDPVEDRNEVVASGLSTEYVTLRIHFADRQLLIQSTKVDDCIYIYQTDSKVAVKCHLRVNMKI